jgi:hypothetical protein
MLRLTEVPALQMAENPSIVLPAAAPATRLLDRGGARDW